MRAWHLRPGDVPELIRKSRRFLNLAEHLIGIGELDSAVSRIYYAMFYCAEALLLTRGRVYSRQEGVISAFGRYFVRSGIFRRRWGNGWPMRSMSGTWRTMRPAPPLTGPGPRSGSGWGGSFSGRRRTA